MIFKFRHFYKILLLSFTLILNSCIAVGPDFVKPEVAEEENWIDIDDACCSIALYGLLSNKISQYHIKGV